MGQFNLIALKIRSHNEVKKQNDPEVFQFLDIDDMNTLHSISHNTYYGLVSFNSFEMCRHHKVKKIGFTYKFFCVTKISSLLYHKYSKLTRLLVHSVQYYIFFYFNNKKISTSWHIDFDFMMSSHAFACNEDLYITDNKKKMG